MPNRIEDDVLGPVKVDSSAYYGSETQRAIQNFPISGLRMPRSFIRAYVILKRSAATSNMMIGKLDKKMGTAITHACDEILEGKLSDQFVVDVFQAGAGTSTNMNVNEVITNLAIRLLKGRLGDYSIVHPNDHVNMSQSTNDTFHCATRIAAYAELGSPLLHALERLKKTLAAKSGEFRSVVKIGRTHIQDAVPMTFGQEFSGYSESVGYCISNIRGAMKGLLELPLGGTALGTGINASESYAKHTLSEINKSTKARFFIAKNRFAAMQNEYAELMCGDALKNTAITLNKIANDFRLLSSGPRAGINEIVLPPVQPGSSIMPGKINPSMAEMLSMVCFQVMGCAAVIDEAANSGQLELNIFMPIIAYNLLFSIQILSNGISAFEKRCARGVKVNKDVVKKYVDSSTAVATALSPYIGYAKAAEIAREAYLKNKSIIDVCIERKVMTTDELKRILDPKRLTQIED